MEPNTQTKKGLVTLIQETAPTQIASLDEVKERFIKNYNLCHKSQNGDLVYSRQLVFFNQSISSNPQLQNCDKFSLYACFVTAAVKGYSFDPQDDEVYLIPRGGKAYLQRQAGAHVRRLIETKQAVMADQAKLVYEGDIFEVAGGRVIKHVECFKTDNIIAGYIRIVLNEKGDDKYFIYRKSDWEAWRKKSPNPKTIEKQDRQGGTYISESPWDNYTLGGPQPDPGFLRTKITLHACKEKSWASGSTPPQVEQFDVITDDADYEVLEHQPVNAVSNQIPVNNAPHHPPTPQPQPQPQPQPVQEAPELDF